MKDNYAVYSDYKSRIDEMLSVSIQKTQPETLYDPLKYILSGGGKRIRPMMLIFSCEAAGGNPEESFNASAAIELLHNFTLVHDDIMDNADTRRGRETIHKKWNNNIAILCGDHLIGMAYSYLFKTKSSALQEIASVFTEGIIEVCEGQSFDKEFETRKDVSADEYLMMIGKKTAKMLETSAVIGALIGNGNTERVNILKSFAHNTGMAFQILDDLLDITADESEFGKKIGGDIVECKKTYLLLKANEFVTENKDREKLNYILENKGIDKVNGKMIEDIKDIYEKYGVIDSAKTQIEKYTIQAEKYLNMLPEPESRERLKWFSQMLMSRSF